MEPPPAPTLWTSTAGDLNWKYPSCMSRRTSVSPFRQSETSVEVLPMSKVRMSGTPISRARYAEPVTPPEGPDRAIWIGLSATASVLIAPPSDRTMERAPPKRLSSMDFSKFLMYSMVRGCTAVLTTVVSVRSYSPYSCPISAEIDTERSEYASRTMSLARRSWEGFTYELRKPMASDSTPLSTSRFTAFPNFVLVQLFEHIAAGAYPLRDTYGVRRVGRRVGFLEGHPAVERAGSPGTGEVQDLLVSLRRQEAHS